MSSTEASPAVGIGSPMPTTLRRMKDQGMTVFETGLLNLNIVAIRSAHPEPNKFNCVLEVHYRDRIGGTIAWFTRTYPITTLPGTTYLEHPMRKVGCAIRMPGQVRASHVVGRHHDRYPALVQVRPVPIVRDNTLDAIPTMTGPIRVELIGCNIHASDNNPFDQNDPVHTDVNAWSAGCFVFRESADYREFWTKLVLPASKQYGPAFTTTLIQQ